MTRKQFELLRIDIQRRKFTVETLNPLKYAVERARFKEGQLQQLIQAGKSVRNSKTVQQRVARWQRILTKLQAVPLRFNEHIDASRIIS